MPKYLSLNQIYADGVSGSFLGLMIYPCEDWMLLGDRSLFAKCL